jgi:hypothetical protein
MNEIRRLHYLNALGIEQWVAKSSLLNARGSEYLAQDSLIEELSSSQLKAETENEVGPEEQNVKKVDAKKAEEKPEAASRAEEQPEQNQTSTEAVNYQIQFFGRAGHYACLVDSSNQALTREDTRLLTNIMKASDSLLSIQGGSFLATEAFNWPLFENSAAPIDQGDEAAKEAFNAFLYAHLKRNKQRFLIVFGGSLETLIADEQLQKAGIQLVGGPSLQSMQSVPDSKASLWKALVETLQ